MALAFRYYIVSLSFLPFILNQTVDNQLFYCVDWNCEEFISRGKTLLNYAGKTDKHLSFRQNEDIKILAKPVDEDGPDWFGTVRRKIGLVPKSMVREDQMGKQSSVFKYPLGHLPILQSSSFQGQQADNISVQTEELEELEKDSTQMTSDNASTSNTTHFAEPEIPVLINSTEKEEETELEGENNLKSNSTEIKTEEENVEPVTEIPQDPEPNEEEDDEEEEAQSSETETQIPQLTIENLQKEPTIDTIDPEPTTIRPETENLQPEIDNTDLINKEEEEKSTIIIPGSDVESVEVDASKQDTVAETIDDINSNQTVMDGVLDDNAEQESESTTTIPTPQDSISEDDNNQILTDKILDQPNVERYETETQTPELQIMPDIENHQPDPTIEAKLENVEAEIKTLEPEPTTIQPEIENLQLETENPTDASVVVSTNEEQEEFSATVIPESVVNDEAQQEPISESIDDDISDKQIDAVSDQAEEEVSESIPESFETNNASDEDTTTQGTISESIHDINNNEISKDPVLDKAEEEVSESLIFSAGSDPILEQVSTTPAPLDESNVQHEIVPEIQELTTTEATMETIVVDTENENNLSSSISDDQHDHTHQHHHHHHDLPTRENEEDTSSFIIIVKHLSSRLLSFLPEHLQDTILDVDDALVFSGIIALTLVSICVPYFILEGFYSVRPLKKKVVELNKSLWKVSTAYENQQEEFEAYKKKALAYDEDRKRVEQLEYELVLLKKLEGKQKEQVTKYQKELKTHKELTNEMQTFLDKEAEKKKKTLEERDKLKTTVNSLKEALRRSMDEFQDAQSEASGSVMELELVKQSNETLTMKIGILEKEVSELKQKIISEVEKRRGLEGELGEMENSKNQVENELVELRKICHKYEDTVSDLTSEIEHKENELMALKETLGEDSPLVDIAELKAQVTSAENTVTSLQSRVESLTLENNSLSRNVKEGTSSLSTVQKERDDALNRLQVLEAWFKEKEEDLRKAVERYEIEKNIRGKDKDELVKMLEDKAEENNLLGKQLEAFKDEFEETKQQHRNELRALETKSHENWLSLCQAERKAQDARKEAELLRQKLTALSKEKQGEDGINGDVFPLITPDMVPLPLPDDVPSYFGLGDGMFMPPPPLPLDHEEREPHRPAPLGRVSPTYSDLEDAISPIRDRRDYSDGNSTSSDSPTRRRSPRGWDRRYEREEEQRSRQRGGPTASSPIHGFNR